MIDSHWPKKGMHSNMDPRFILVGGFLGAGKTTTIARLAKMYAGQGKRIGIVTNDQAPDLVDTLSLQSQGFEVGEVAGACFCCSFNELTATVDRISEDALPDVILAEPVGSCTDLVATVIRPLTHIYRRPLSIAPYGVILKPSHGSKILRNDPRGGFSPQAAYIFRKQLEEADLILLNRIDELSEIEADELQAMLEAEYPERPVLRISARRGDGFDVLGEFLARRGSFGLRKMELDYDRYAEGEAELGWLNAQVHFQSSAPFALDRLLLDVVSRLQRELSDQGQETAHLKVIGMWDGHYAVANVVSSFTAPEISLSSGASVPQADVVVNARVAVDPETLEQTVRRHLRDSASAIGATVRIDSLQSFRPGRPVPTHRLN